jgi:CRP/FNR family cyclic AMP-dependent transcriptional regulator
MIERFREENGLRILSESLREQKLVAGDSALAEKLSKQQLLEVKTGESIIEQGAATNDLYLIVTGRFNVFVNGRIVAQRSTGDSVGEMSAIQPTQRRSATVTATEDSVVLMVTEAEFSKLTLEFPNICRVIAKELAKRLEERNALVTGTSDRIQIFVISSVEALPIARAIQNAFAYDRFNVTVWTDGVFKASTYPIPSLEMAVDQSDFAIAIVQPDDTISTRSAEEVNVPRDNVIFELGLFIGRLGLRRTFLVEPRGMDIKLPSDWAGITPLGYQLRREDLSKSQTITTAIAPACNQMRDIMNDLGPK